MYKVKIEVVNTITNEKFNIEDEFNLAHMQVERGICTTPSMKFGVMNKEPNGNEKTTIILGKGITYIDENLDSGVF